MVKASECLLEAASSPLTGCGSSAAARPEREGTSPFFAKSHVPGDPSLSGLQERHSQESLRRGESVTNCRTQGLSQEAGSSPGFAKSPSLSPVSLL